MEKFQLSLLFKIIGIGSASGLVYLDEKLYIISDSSTYLYEYNIAETKLDKIALVDYPQESIAKKDKPDFESITYNGSHLSIFGSGSTENRNTILLYNPTLKKSRVRSMLPAYSQIKLQNHIKEGELNIEGFISAGKFTYYFQRGNGLAGKNGIFYTEMKDEMKIPDFKYIQFDLPKIKNVPATFTDAILVDDTIYFLAAAEDTNSTYTDGEILGSMIGTIDLKTMALKSCIQISDKSKFEGLTLYKKTATQIELLLCEDNDTKELASSIYKLVLDKTQ